MEHAKTEEKSTVRRDRLLKIEEEAHDIWEKTNFYESNPEPGRKKYMVTFPYPYMNGRLHLGHGYSMSKAEFTIRYKRLKGYNALWPFAFHCTGMPIGAAAIKLQREFEAQGDNISKWANDSESLFKTEKEEFQVKMKAAKNDSERAQLEKNFKFTAKLSQYTILKMCGISESEIHKFKDPNHWLLYFPEVGKQDLKRFGVHVDHRRSFITTETNPYYDAFVRWQFRKLKEREYCDFGKRPTIFAPTDRQPCADHDRADGEGVNPQEYTGIKLRLLDFPNRLKALEGRNVFLIAATLRPETMYGQTNCFILPTGKYGAYEGPNDEVFIVSERAAKNMAWQGLTKEPEKISSLLDIEGLELIGCALKAPLATYEKVYLFPMLSISMEKGTGIVTSVPSDAPADWVNLKDLKNKPEWRKKWGLTDEMVLPYEPIPILDVPELGKLSALKVCEDLKVGGPNDAKNLEKAKDICYDASFYKGVMLIGKYAGQKIFDVKTSIRADMIAAGEALVYWEPDGKVTARSGEPCVVAFCDQWYLKYGEPNWQKQILDHVKSENFNAYNDGILKAFTEAIGWLKEWAFSRNFGQGTRVPWDESYLIESLSDSTIYMSYYTIAHYFQGDIEGTKPGLLGVSAKDLNDDVFDYIFLAKEYKAGSISEETLKKLRDEFEYWYPMDLRVSAKDLVRNHLTMALYNHAAIWQDNKFLPRGFFCNGYITVNGEKMSKQKGNFLTIDDCISRYGADATRVALADAGDTLDDANFVEESANSSILRLANFDTWLKWAVDNIDKFRGDSDNDRLAHIDRAYSQAFDRCVYNTDKAYEAMRFRDVLKYGLYELTTLKEDYVLACGEEAPRMNKNIILKYIETQLLLLYPICPHFAEVAYIRYLRPYLTNAPEFISLHKFPEVEHSKIDFAAVQTLTYLKDLSRTIRLSLEKVQSKKKGDKTIPKKCNIIIASKYFPWQLDVLDLLNKYHEIGKGTINDNDWKKEFRDRKDVDKEVMKKSLMFGTFVIETFNSIGKDALLKELTFDERRLIELNIVALKEEFKVEEFIIHEASVVATHTDRLWSTAGGNCLPGKPQIIFE